MAWFNTKKIGKATVIYGEKDGKIHLISLRVPSTARGQGEATDAMKEVIAEADAKGLPMELVASPLDSKTKRERLMNFYRRFGFEVQEAANPAGDRYMRRPARVVAKGFGFIGRSLDLSDRR